ncbi:MAG: hypothetical protein PHU68_05705 [Paludibacter sp.]|nr:hypothetical protein [Paludibacter sp.]
MKKALLFTLLISLLSYTVYAGEGSDNYVKLGGAFRLNLVSTGYEQPSTATNTYATLDTWRLNVDAKYSGVRLDFEYRFYPTFNTHFIHHGYLGYDINPSLNVQLGVTQVPFGNLSYNSHSWWFLIPYYLGLEDDYDMGLKFTWLPTDRLDIRAAYFRQAEPAGPSYGNASFGGPAAGTYSYNVIPDEEGVLSASGATASIREMNQFNLRLAYLLFEGTTIGVSGQVKGLYNSVLQEITYGHALAAHVNSNFSNFNLKLQYTTYDYKAKDDAGAWLSRVQMGAYGDPYYNDGVASRADVVTAGLSYTIPVNLGPVSAVLPYVNYSLMMKKGNYEHQGEYLPFTNSVMVVPGVMLTAGKIYTYIDLAMGKNQPWLTDSFGMGLGKGHSYTDQPADYYYNTGKAGMAVPLDKVKWNYRFNINIGYYF